MELHVRLRSSKVSPTVLLCTESRSYVYYVRAVVWSFDRFPFGTYAPGLHTPLALVVPNLGPKTTQSSNDGWRLHDKTLLL